LQKKREEKQGAKDSHRPDKVEDIGELCKVYLRAES
jgi:hypothetical protein